MRSRYKVIEEHQPHFITCTVVEWLPILFYPSIASILIDSLNFCRTQKGLKIYAWVILDNHLHAILAAPHLSDLIRDFKSFTAQKILTQLMTEKRSWIINQLTFHRDLNKNEQYKIWQEGFHPQLISNDEILLQKMQYIHHNPVKRGWVQAPEHWKYSSAHEFLTGSTPLMHCDRINEHGK